MSPMISKPLFATLLAAVVASVLLWLKPETVATDEAADLLAPARSGAGRGTASGDLPSPGKRAVQTPPAWRNRGYAPPPPPPPPVVAPVVVKPTAPNPPFVYLGRMVRDGENVIFLGQGENVVTVAVGDEIDRSWRLESIGETALQLRYLPLDETRQLVTSK